MRVCKAAFFVLTLLTLAALVFAQDVLHVNAKAIQQHIDQMAYPTFPPIAKDAHVQGTVVFDLRIGVKGQIESMKVVSGPPMLQQAAIDCLKQWTFHPFENNGVPVVAEGQYSIIFSLGASGGAKRKTAKDSHGANQESQATRSQTITVQVKSETSIQGVDPKTEQQFQEHDDACKHGVFSKEFNDATVSSCRQAAELADQLPPNGNDYAKRSAFVYAATAFGDVKDFQQGLPWAVKAVEVVKLGHDSESGSHDAYSIKGQIEGFLGDFLASDRDLTFAEDSIRKLVIRDSKEPQDSKNVSRINRFIEDLTFHAKVLQQLSRFGEAQKKLDEAAQLIK